MNNPEHSVFAVQVRDKLNACAKHSVIPRTHVLCHYLLYFNNLSAVKDDDYWPVWFSVDNRVLVKALEL